MLHKNLKEAKLPHRELQRLAAPPHPDRLPIKKKLADDYQVLQRSLPLVGQFVHSLICYWSTFANRSSSA